MSQSGTVERPGGGPSPPDVPTEFIADIGSAVPILNILEVFGDTQAAGATPVHTTGSGNTLTAIVQLSQANAASSVTRAGLSSFDSASFAVDANGFVTLSGGGEAIDSVAVQSGTSPIVPTVAGLITINGSVVAAGTNPIRSNGTGANTLDIQAQISQAIAATDATKIGLSNFNSTQFSVDANGFVSLAGGGLAVDSFALQTGTTPIAPTAAGLITFSGGVVAAGTNPVRTDGTGANTMVLEVQTSQALAAADATKIGLCNFNSASFTVTATGFVSLSGTGAATTITGDTGGALAPTAGNWNIVSTTTNGIDTSGSGSTLTIGMASPYADASFSFARSASGSTNTLTVSNTSNTASSNALLQHTVAGTSGGDALATFTVTGATDWSIGVDNSDSDSLVIAPSTALGTNNILVATTAGSITQTQVGTSTPLRYNLRNTDTNALSTAQISTNVAGGSAADSYFMVGIEATNNFAFGIDNSDADKFKITWDAAAVTPSGAAYFVMTTAGEITKPLQPAFLATSAGTANVTGNAAAATIAFGNEIFDQNVDFASTTFTSPVTGRYQLNTNILSTGWVASTNCQMDIVTSNRTYRAAYNPIGAQSTGSGPGFCLSVLADMDAADTATVVLTATGESGNIADITANLSTFSGHLAC